jgi:hypothetical protein
LAQTTTDTNGGANFSFTTTVNLAPVITNVAVPTGTLLSTSAIVTFTTDKLATSTILYGTVASQTCDYPSSITTTAFGTAQSIVLTGLTADTTYNYCLKTSDVAGTVSALMSGLSFTTLAGPVITNVVISNLSDDSATISWNTATSSDSFVYYASSATGSLLNNPIKAGLTPLVSESSPGVYPHQIVLTGLTAGQAYLVAVESTDGAGNIVTDTNGGVFYSIPAVRDNTPPTITNIDAPVRALNAAAIVWQTSENATSQVYYGTSPGSYTKETAKDSTKTIWHVMTLASTTLNAFGGATDVSLSNNDLTPNTPYYFVVVSADAAGNYATSTESTFTTSSNAVDATLPVISSIAVPGDTQLSSFTAVVTFNTDKIAQGTIQYRVAGATPWIDVVEPSYALAHAVTISGLTPGTTYNTQVFATDVVGNVSTTVAGPDFTTKSGPAIMNVNSLNVTGEGATVSWDTDVTSDSYVYYSRNALLTGQFTAGSAEMVAETTPGVFHHQVSLSNLVSATQYYFQVKSTNNAAVSSVSPTASPFLTFTTTADAMAPVIDSISVPVMASNEAVVVWKTDEPATSQVLYGTTTGDRSKFSITDLTKSIYHVVTLSPETVNAGAAGGTNELTAETPYYYVVKSADIAGNTATSPEQTFTTPSTGNVTIVAVSVVNNIGAGTGITPDTIPPTISTIVASSTDSFNEAISFTTNEDAVAFVDYGKTTSYGDSVGSPILTQSHNVKIHGLTMGTSYHFRVKAIDKAGNQTTADDMTFNTPFLSESTTTVPLDDTALLQSKIEDLVQSALPSLTAPFITAPVITNIAEHGATVSWKSNVKAYGVLSYATDEDFKRTPNVYTLDITSGAARQTEHTVKLVNLKSNTKYHLQASGYVFQEVVGKSDDLTFTTKPAQIVGTITERKKDSFTVAWTTDEPTTSIVEFKDVVTGLIEKNTDVTMRTVHSMRVSSLPAGTTYEVNVSGLNALGNTLEAVAPLTVTTSRDVTPPVITGFNVNGTLVPGRTDRIQTVISWKTDEPSDSVVYYEEGAGTPGSTKELANKVTPVGPLVQNHSVILASLKPGTIYRIKVTSTDDSGNTASFGPRTIITPQQTQSITDIIFKNFEDSFKFLRQI